ncbi:MAG TPA: DNA-binding response regulator, partial [Bacteroidales bacterium]|nr:DNA-binding response regulator [Bacteroidales bacterium]
MKIILIIEDDTSILRGLKDNLEFEGYRVIAETNGKAGLEHALGKNIDLLLLDIMLPGMNGYEICRKIKKEKPDLPIIMLTARGSEMDKVSGLDTGADDYVTKPFSIKELLGLLASSQERRCTGEKLLYAERFGDIIIRSEIQPQHDIRLL